MTAQAPAYLQYTVRNGLPGNLVYCCVQDRRGLLWFGTDKGLSSYDGVRFRNYSMADGLPDPDVLGIKEDSYGRLWLFCFQKSLCYMFNGQIITARQDSILAKMDLSSGLANIYEDKKRNIWYITMSKKIYRSDNKNISVFEFPYIIYGLAEIEDAFLAFDGSNVMALNSKGLFFKIYSMFKRYGTTSLNISVSKNRILYSHADRATLLEYKNGHISKISSKSHPSGGTFTDRSGRFWICSPTTGAVCFDNDQQDLSNPTVYLPDKKVTTMFEDRQGTFWFCTIDEGIIALPKNTPMIYGDESIPSRNIRSVKIDSMSRLFIGDNLGNINVLSKDYIKTMNIYSKKTYDQVRDICVVDKKNLCAVTDKGLYFFTNSFRDVSRKTKFIALKSIAVQGHKIWYASASRMGYFHLPSQTDVHIIDNYRFTSICNDSENNIWAGSINGFYSQLDSFQKNWGDAFPELNNKIITIKNGYDGKLWVATPNNGLLKVKVSNGSVTSVDVINKTIQTPVENIQSLFVEENRTVWMATNRGVYALDTSNNIRHFDSHDGLADDDVNAVLVHNDTLWAGTVAGLTRMVLKQVDENGDFPTYITTLKYQKDNDVKTLWLIDSVSHRSDVTLPIDATNIELVFAGLDYRSRGNLRFEVVRYQELMPLKWWTFNNLFSWATNQSVQKDTVTSSSQTLSLGTYFPPGKYRMTVVALKTSGLRSNYPDTWTFIKPPFWYETIWFHLVLWLLAVYGIWRIYLTRVAYQTALAAASELQLRALQAQINPHFIGNAINAIQQFLHPPDPEKASDYIAVFMRLLRRTMQFSESTFISFQDELDYDKEYLQLARLRFENQFRYEITGEEEVPATTFIPAMILQPILENATIHGVRMQGASLLKLEFSFKDSLLSCKVIDDGLGFKETMQQKLLTGSKRESKGIAILQKKIQSLNTIYNLDLNLSIQDLSETGPNQQGTQVTFTYSPDLIWKTLAK